MRLLSNLSHKIKWLTQLTLGRLMDLWVSWVMCNGARKIHLWPIALQSHNPALLAMTVHRHLNGHAALYLSDYCVPVTSADTRWHLRSANRQLLAVPRYRLNFYSHRAHSCLCSCWPHILELSSGFHVGPDHQCRLFQTFAFDLFAQY